MQSEYKLPTLDIFGDVFRRNESNLSIEVLTDWFALL